MCASQGCLRMSAHACTCLRMSAHVWAGWHETFYDNFATVSASLRPSQTLKVCQAHPWFVPIATTCHDCFGGQWPLNFIKSPQAARWIHIWAISKALQPAASLEPLYWAAKAAKKQPGTKRIEDFQLGFVVLRGQICDRIMWVNRCICFCITHTYIHTHIYIMCVYVVNSELQFRFEIAAWINGFFRIPACVRNTMWPREVTVDICESKLPITSYNSPKHPITSYNKLQLAASFSKDSSRPCSSSRSFSIKHGVLCQQGASRDARESGRLKGDWKRIRGGCDPIESIYCNWLHKLHILLDISGWCSTKYLDIFKISSRYDKSYKSDLGWSQDTNSGGIDSVVQGVVLTCFDCTVRKCCTIIDHVPPILAGGFQHVIFCFPTGDDSPDWLTF